MHLYQIPNSPKGFTLQSSDCLSVSLRMNPHTVWRELISVACDHCLPSCDYSKLMTIVENWNMHQLSNWELCLCSQLPLRCDSLVYTQSVLFPSQQNDCLRQHDELGIWTVLCTSPVHESESVGMSGHMNSVFQAFHTFSRHFVVVVSVTVIQSQ